MALYLNILFYIKLQTDILKIPQVEEFSNSSPYGMSVHFIPYRKDKNQDSPEKDPDGW